MKRLPVIIGILVMASALVVGSGYGQDKKDTQPDKAKVQLPASWNFAKIGLTPEQKGKVYEIIGNYQGKIKSLQDQIDKLRNDEYAEAYKLLNDTQKGQVKPPAKADPGKDTGPDKKKDTAIDTKK